MTYEKAHRASRSRPHALQRAHAMSSCCGGSPAAPDLAQPLLGSLRGGAECRAPRQGPPSPAASAGALPDALRQALREQAVREQARESSLRFFQQALEAQQACREAGRRLQQLEAEARQRAQRQSEVRQSEGNANFALPACLYLRRLALAAASRSAATLLQAPSCDSFLCRRMIPLAKH